ncbi:DNA methyltransferase, partial [Arthrospira platensis SPKY1]|nr:DNA methyltransferase [Arthrospira platensis SPKY1]
MSIEARAPSAFSTVNPGVFKASEYLLWYAKNKSLFRENALRTKRMPDYAYNKWLENPDEHYSIWKFIPLLEAYESSSSSRSRRPDSLFEHFNRFIVDNASRICRLASISDTGAGHAIVEAKRQSLQQPSVVLCVVRSDNLDNVYILDGQQVIFYEKNVIQIEGRAEATAPLTNIWTDIAWEGIANEGGVTFRKGKKPERLIHRCLSLASNPGDLVLDSFAGSG